MPRANSPSRAATRGLAAITLMIGSLSLAGCGGDVEAALAELTIGGAQDTRHEQSKDVARRVEVGARTQLDFSFPVGELEVVNGPAGAITLEGELTVKGKDAALVAAAIQSVDFKIAQSTRQIAVSLTELEDDSLQYEVDLKITLPRGMDLEAALKVGEMNVTLEGSKKVEISLSVGEVNVDLKDAGKAEVSVNIGEANLTLDGMESLEVSVNIGEVNVRVPADLDAQITASTKTGEVNVRGFDAMATEQDSRRGFVGHTIEAVVGDPARAAARSIEVTASIGEINIRGARAGDPGN